MRRFTNLLKRFRRDESGAFLVLFAVIAIVLIATSGAVVDFTYMQTARSRAQNALDSAALALQTHINDTNAATTIKSQAQTILQERLADSRISATVTDVLIDTGSGKLNLKAQITVPTAFVQLVGIKNISRGSPRKCCADRLISKCRRRSTSPAPWPEARSRR